MKLQTGKHFGLGPLGEDVFLYRVGSAQMHMDVITYGAAIVSLDLSDRNRNKLDVVLGFDSVDDYMRSIDLPAPPHFGAAIGRWAGRINKGIFNLNGHEYHLAANNNGHSLHGGRNGFSQRVWTVLEYDPARSITMGLDSENGDENFPGHLEVKVTYTLEPDKLIVDFHAFALADTIVNLTQHSYFNLDGHLGHVLDQKLFVRSDAILDTRNMIPTGKILAAEDTNLDFRTPRACPKEIDATFVLNREDGPAASLTSDKSALTLEVYTTQPAIHIYIGGDLDGKLKGKGGAAYHRHSGICFETQNFPDAPNHRHFPSPILRAGETYRHQTIYQFKIHQS